MHAHGLFAEIRRHPLVLLAVLLFHLLLAVLLGINLVQSDDRAGSRKPAKIIDAVVVDARQIELQQQRKKQRAERKRQAALKKARAEAAKKAKAEAAAKKARAEAERKAREVARRKAEQAALAKRQAREKARQEKARQEQLRREKEARERKRRAAEEKQRQEAARRREAQRRAEEKAEFEQALQEEERLQEEARLRAEREARNRSLRAQYVKMIARKVENNWLRPADARSGQSCDVIVTQTYTGDVLDVRLQSCQADKAFRRSVILAVEKASPLPLPPNPDVFDRQIYFTFKPH